MLLIRFLASTHEDEEPLLISLAEYTKSDVELTVAQPFGFFIFALNNQTLHDLLVIVVEG